MANDKTPPTFLSYTRNVVESFLQTVVVLDDLAVMSPIDTEQMSAAVSGTIEVPNYPGPSLPAPTLEPDGSAAIGARLDATAVINGFADIGSVCAVLSPAPNDEFRDRTIKAAHRADIVILDWKIHDSVGDKALSVMRDILQADQQRLRLIAIYTGEPNLHEIAKRTKEVVDEFYEEDELVELSAFQMAKGPLRVVVLAKEGALNGQPDLKCQEVTEHQLAHRLASDFALMTGGLVRNSAIAGIAAIRDNAHRILAEFDTTLDPAYLGHRLLLSHPPDAEEHIAEALGSELISVLEESRIGTHANADAIQLWLAHREHDGLNLSDPFTFPQGLSAIDGWCNLLLLGIDRPGVALPTKKSTLRRQAAAPFSENSEDATRSNRRFAALLSLKARYPSRDPKLTIGTILRTQDGHQNAYWLCLQPKCDSVRLDAPSGFPLMPLVPLERVAVGADKTPLRLVVETGRDQWINLGIEPKPSELSIRFFVPGPNPPGEVIASEEQPGEFCFRDADGKEYFWVAAMKDEHALEVAGQVASALARPGPNNAEWLRKASGTPR